MTRAGRPRVVVLGAGFAGLAVAARLGGDLSVSVVDRKPHFEFLPNIHELVSGVKTPRLLRLPADRIVRRSGHRFVQGTVEGIDLAARQVRITGRRPLAYDALLVGLGGVNATHGVAGAAEHALPFKSVDDCARIGRRLRELSRSREAHDVVIVGGGLEGVEALGEILRRHRGGRLRVHLVEARSRLLPEAPRSLDTAVRELASREGVQFVLSTPVAEVRKDAVVLESGRSLGSSATIWTGGPAPPTLLESSGLAPRAREWAPVFPTLQSVVAPEVFVVGDAAALPEPIAKQAYHALDMGACAAANVRRHLAGREPRSYRPSEKPMLLSFGDLSGFMVVGGRALAGPSLATAKEAVYELVMAQLDRRSPHEAGFAALARMARASRELAWPALSSPAAWPRLARLSIL